MSLHIMPTGSTASSAQWCQEILLPALMCAGMVLPNVEETSWAQLTPSVPTYSQRNRQLGWLLHLRDVFGLRVSM